MRFLSDLICCFCIDPAHKLLLPPSTPPRTAETLSLVPMSCGENKQHGRRGKLGGRNLAPAAQWRPSLCTISEDDVVKVVVAEKEKSSTARPRNKVNEKLGSKTNLQYYYRHQIHYEPSIPTFSPGAFIF
ncbi:uncharacterized protein LOC132307284 [Cornus florida]|uniref:uncharacterized protein LOC132307284 n=1 Tax=Cornus florida TaxID=4283 RepID=UPI0028976E05|nr:uncharacterized protein LOC132307284 [Cornus florida]